MTIIIYKSDGKDLTEISRWNKGEITNANNDRVIKMDRKDVIRKFNNGYYLTKEIKD